MSLRVLVLLTATSASTAATPCASGAETWAPSSVAEPSAPVRTCLIGADSLGADALLVDARLSADAQHLPLPGVLSEPMPSRLLHAGAFRDREVVVFGTGYDDRRLVGEVCAEEGRKRVVRGGVRALVAAGLLPDPGPHALQRAATLDAKRLRQFLAQDEVSVVDASADGWAARELGLRARRVAPGALSRLLHGQEGGGRPVVVILPDGATSADVPGLEIRKTGAFFYGEGAASYQTFLARNRQGLEERERRPPSACER